MPTRLFPGACPEVKLGKGEKKRSGEESVERLFGLKRGKNGQFDTLM